jgi:hypothetical protein
MPQRRHGAGLPCDQAAAKILRSTHRNAEPSLTIGSISYSGQHKKDPKQRVFAIIGVKRPRFTPNDIAAKPP